MKTNELKNNTDEMYYNQIRIKKYENIISTLNEIIADNTPTMSKIDNSSVFDDILHRIKELYSSDK